MQLIGFFDHGARLWPERACLTDDTRTLSYREVEQASHRIARALQAAGCGIETRCAVYSPNCALAFEAILGITRAGGTWLPCNALAVPREVLAFLQAHHCAVLFFHSRFETQAREFAAAATRAPLLICLDRPCAEIPALHEWSASHAGQAQMPADDPGRVAIIKPTGGTTGLAKSVMQTHGNFEALTACFLSSMPFDEPPVHLVAAPITHGAGSICFPLFACGASHVILERAEAGAVLKAIEAHAVNVLFLPPTVIYMMLAHPDLHRHNYRSLKYFIYAAAPMSVDKLKLAVEVFGPVMAQTYGQAEAPMLCTYLGPRDHDLHSAAGRARLASCGRPTPFTQVAIMADDGALLQGGERGEIVVRGALVFKGYHDNAPATAEVSTHGWHHTGDIGWQDDDGYVYIVDRKKDMIITGGFNVFPSEVEQVIWSYPAVQDCAVIGVPDDKWGEAIKAVVELKPGATLDVADLLEYCRRELGGVKAPKSVEIWAELPRSAVGKVLKKEVRRLFWSDRERAI